MTAVDSPLPVLPPSRTRTGYWSDFADSLVADGKQPSTVANYVSQARRITLACPQLTQEDVDAYIDTLNPALQGQYRTAWRVFIAWAEKKGVLVASVRPRRTPSPPDDVVHALRLLRQAGITSKALHALRWDVRTDAALNAHYPESILLGAPAGEAYQIVPVSSAIAEALHAWGYPGVEYPLAGAEAPLVPSWPGSPSAMPLATLRRLLAPPGARRG